MAEADVGLVRYAATLLGTDSEITLRWFVLVALLLDPATLLLWLVATSARRSTAGGAKLTAFGYSVFADILHCAEAMIGTHP